MRTRLSILVLLCAMCLGLAACDFGDVDQGRCVAYNAADQTFTMILDVNHDAQNPQYTGGVMTFKLPADPKEMGPEPTAGGRVHFDVDKSTVTLFLNGEVKTLDVKFTDVQKGVKKTDPRVKGKKFPEINKEKGTVTEYSKRLKSLLTFEVPAEYLDLPEETWKAGDECRVYYKPNAKHQVLRFMNVTKTNIFKK